MPLRILAALLLTVAAGCVGLQPPTFPGATQQPTVERAQTAVLRGDHAQAAATYEALAARAAATDRNALLLLATRSWLAAARSVDAARVLGMLGTGLTAEQGTQRRILDAEITLANGQAQTAWTRISAVAEPTMPGLAGEYLDARMRIAMAAARPVDAVRAEISAERFAGDAMARSRLRTQLLAQLRLARERGIKLEAAASQDGIVRGWLDLGAMAGNTRGVSLTGGSDAQRWRTRYPGHPATELLNDALPPAFSGAGVPDTIALLLPVGRADAQLVRDGFRYAIAQLPSQARPTLRVYDTGNAPVTALLQQARSEGAQFIVGPLTREEVTIAADSSPAVPVLALNFLTGDRGGPAGFYQFALSPEDEARAVARRILASGQRRGVAVAPSGDWGTRVLAAFTQELQNGRGVLLAQVSYDPNSHDYGEQIKLALGTTDSEARLKRVQGVVGGKLEFEPRRRADLDFIFAPGMSTNARLLRPQLRFQYAGDVPIYATSAAFAPEAGASNRDLDGIIYPDMPWLLPDSTVATLKQDAEQSAASNGWSTRLFAFGYDACQLALSIAGAGGDARRVLVSGLTGQLSLDQGGRVHRELQWAQISDGEPRLLGAPANGN